MKLTHLHRLIEAQAHRKALRDLMNRLRFGAGAPLSDETIWIRPRDVTHVFQRTRAHDYRRRHSGLVLGGDWDRQRRPLEGTVKYDACVAHFAQGVPWDETGIYDEMLRRIAEGKPADGCKTRDDIVARYARMDALFDHLRRTGRFERMRDLPDHLRREHGGVFVHIDRDGLPLLAGNGNHRMAMARVLDLPVIPAHLGVIHRQALESGQLAGLRKPPEDRAAR
ncbi:hypothetical protein [Aestuariicoccus sp. MJ-SS9]|uniref:hypothetical protein n=1 Tax=Aestuariicoccus sp. MJ-SS9 TaxID=3079855 RepID=UPI0029154240|nr:hypothetical protein [Aestuariicoccus sp. MJ-SS9]MDU8909900.1 hypothetical protein [Aestuariicoccus sp. MJ-SS9]